MRVSRGPVVLFIQVSLITIHFIILQVEPWVCLQVLAFSASLKSFTGFIVLSKSISQCENIKFGQKGVCATGRIFEGAKQIISKSSCFYSVLVVLMIRINVFSALLVTLAFLIIVFECTTGPIILLIFTISSATSKNESKSTFKPAVIITRLYSLHLPT